ncbi:hypothetical protein L228DRAFT_245723 [Xylona heveae TC161]|uniref:Conidiation-specific protein 8 n=1 Tax=Xylona heveae (strain CBS 132557 / TC161) TaxID=1328760 RepID=A0A165ID48_XYLHT|nr:hypothetical protein L228DRAFT_245723 [Xylona heveae TC161]KZF24730.1 hypothetical protein L228DRAFT_245723 [Xylona heveae TC161]
MSNSSQTQQSSAVRGGAGAVPTPANAGASGSFGVNPNRRRSSQGQGLFSGLMNQKRNPDDAMGAQRRMSASEQAPQPGMFGKMWNSWTKGSPPPSGGAGATRRPS